MGNKLEPPMMAIKAGYNMMKARQAILAGDYQGHYLSEAIHCAEMAIPELVKESGMYYMEPAKGMRLLHESAAVVYGDPVGMHERKAAGYKIGEAHDHFRKMMKRNGYRTITDRDFAEHGSGGGR